MEYWRAGMTAGQLASRHFSGKNREHSRYAFEVKLVPTVAVFVLVVLAVVAGYRLGTKPGTVATPAKKTAAISSKPASKPIRTPAIDPLAGLSSDMNAAIASQPSLSASATLINLATGKVYNAGNYTQNYEAASTAKLIAVFDYIHQVELGKASLTQTIEGQSAQDIIMRMIVYSDNDAWTELNTYLSMSQEQQYVNSLGLTGTVIQIDNIQFSTPNMAKLLQLLYNGTLMNDSHRAMVYDYMSHTTMNALIPAVLPGDVTVYHKYGQIDGVLHDAAIIEYQGHDCILVVYTNNPAGTTGLYDTQVQLIHAVTTAAFNDVMKS